VRAGRKRKRGSCVRGLQLEGGRGRRCKKREGGREGGEDRERRGGKGEKEV